MVIMKLQSLIHLGRNRRTPVKKKELSDWSTSEIELGTTKCVSSALPLDISIPNFNFMRVYIDGYLN